MHTKTQLHFLCVPATTSPYVSATTIRERECQTPAQLQNISHTTAEQSVIMITTIFPSTTSTASSARLAAGNTKQIQTWQGRQQDEDAAASLVALYDELVEYQVWAHTERAGN